MVSSDSDFRNRSAKGWKERIIIPTLLAGALGGAAGLVSKNRRTLGLANVSAAYAANLAIVAVCYCGARELARDARQSEPDDLINSAVGGFASGALLGRLQGGHIGAIRYSIIFAAAGTALDFTESQLRPILHRFMNTVSEGSCDKNDRFSSWWKMPEWSPIQVLDEEALAAKQAKEEKLGVQGVLGNQNKER
ncbi:hypothetical protein KSP39_PZI002363 [Platanthera zijinensis]|uniref:Mitochondrial inner membrane translocase subunit Tim17/Tim22/Tim23/peroxisomal protein PMP24 n=1 Tax=Platanthera zijinensis TaxID=2320716 RepID=A0AAP0C0S8_9ASPA